MTVAFDAFTANANQTADHNFNHTPVGTPRAVIVWIVERAATADHIAGVTYGGDAMTEVSGSPNILATGETGVTYCYFLGTSIPTGVQSVAVDTTATSNYITYCVTLTAANDCTVVDSDGTINGTAVTNPSVTLSLSGKTSWAGLALHSGQQAVTGITPLTNWTSRSETDRGTDQAACYTYNTIASTDVTAGWTQSAEDASAVCIAVTDVSAQLFERTIDENDITIVGTTSKISILPRSISQTVTVADTITRFKLGVRAISESVLITAPVARIASLFRTISENAVDINEILTGNKLLTRVINESQVTVSDSIVRLKTAIRDISQSILIVAPVDRIANKFRTISENPVDINETLTKVKIGIRSATESILVSDSITRLKTAIRSISQTVLAQDTISRMKTAIRSISQSVTIIGDVAREFIAGGGTLFPVVINEGQVTVAATISRFKLGVRAISESILIVGNVTRLANFFRSISQTTTVSDSVSKVATRLRSISETISVSDTLSRLATKLRSISQSVTTSDVVSKSALKLRSITENAINIIGNVSRVFLPFGGGQLFEVVINESVAVLDNLSAIWRNVQRIGGKASGGNYWKKQYEMQKKKWSVAEMVKKYRKRIGLE